MNARKSRTLISLVGLLTAGLTVAAMSSANAAAVTVPLGTASDYAILAGQTITKTGPITVRGDIGVYPGSAISGTGAITQVGTTHVGDSNANIAKHDLLTGYNNAAGQTTRQPVTADLAGQTLKQGVHNSASSLALNGTLTLDGENDPDAVFVFQAGSSLTTGPGSKVNLINGASACNVYWQVGSSATLNTTTDFVGTIMALKSITLDTGATVQGRVLARNGSVTLDSNTITRPRCTPASDSDDSGSAGTTSQVTKTPRGSVDTGR